MTEPFEPETAETEPASRTNPWWWVAAIAVIAIPVLIGFVLLRSDSGGTPLDGAGGTAAGDDMGGGDMGGSSDGGATSDIRDFSEIQATDIRFDLDPDAGAAVLNVDTTIDVACSVVYGPTTDFGSLATDTDMAGGAHAIHHPRLTGISAGTVWYRLQGTAEDGTIYRSEAAQFSLPEGSGTGPTVEPPLPNVASRATVTDVSSEYSDAYAALNAVDGDLSTEWSSAGDGDDAYIVLDFGEDMRIRGVGFRTREMSDGTSITTTFTVTVDGKTYGPFDAGPGLAIGLFEALGQTVRVDVDTSTGGNTGAVEIEVYAESDM